MVSPYLFKSFHLIPQQNTTTEIHNYDWVFIGFGAANCLLIKQFAHQNLLNGKKLLIIEPETKTKNDRTFCLWATAEERERLNIDSWVSNIWSRVEIKGISNYCIEPMQYVHIKGINVYNQTRALLKSHDVTILQEPIYQNPQQINNGYQVCCGEYTIHAQKVFDSRPPKYLPPLPHQSHLLQSFWGITIECDSNIFDTSTITMMDFNVPQLDATQFVYVLPFKENTALIELTRFGKELLTEKEAKFILDDYLASFNINYKIIDQEQGVIPMSSASLMQENYDNHWMAMGARANLLKPTTGYAFHKMAKDALLKAESIKQNIEIEQVKKKSRFQFYDRLLLKILETKPAYGKRIFETLFTTSETPNVLKFLNEETTFLEDARILLKLPKWVFIRCAVNDILFQISRIQPAIIALLLTVIIFLLNVFQLNQIGWGLLGLGLFTFGLTHGAIDHIYQSKSTFYLPQFIIKYIMKGAVFGVIWILLPDAALFLFIAYSAWHFGEADFGQWGLKQHALTFCWGMLVLLFMFVTHVPELIFILNQIRTLTIPYQSLLELSPFQLAFIIWVITLAGMIMAIYHKSKYMLITLAYLVVGSQLPLLSVFGIYFIYQHSLNGWKHLTKTLPGGFNLLWRQSLPFTIAAVLFICIFLYYNTNKEIGTFFILLSCLSVPHIYCMHQLYVVPKSKA